MKNYEKAYKEALKAMEGLYNVMKYQLSSDALLTLERLKKAFPELCESEDERIREDIIAILKGEITYTTEEDAKRYIAWLEKHGKQKSSDKVEPKFKVGDTVTIKPMSCCGKVFTGEPFRIVDIIEDNYVSDDGKTYSISLQDGWELVEQNPAWSEDDEEMLDAMIDIVSNSLYEPLCPREGMLAWLKSLKPNHWKPSEEQMGVLNNAIHFYGKTVGKEVLESLYNDLKTL